MASQETKIALAKFLNGIGKEAVEKANPTKEVYCRVIIAYGSKPKLYICLLYTSPSPRDRQKSRMPSSA